jgi:hypothetical protein
MTYDATTTQGGTPGTRARTRAKAKSITWDNSDDFESYLKRIVADDLIDAIKSDFANAAGKIFDGQSWEDLKYHERALAVLIWGWTHPQFRKAYIHAALLYQVARNLKKPPKLGKVGDRPGSSEFADTKFDEFYSRLCRLANKTFDAGGILLKNSEPEPFKKGGTTYMIRVFHFCYSGSQDDRFTGGVLPARKSLTRAEKMYVKKHGGIVPSGLNHDNRAVWDQDKKFIDILTGPKIAGLFAPVNLPSTKNGTMPDPSRK